MISSSARALLHAWVITAPGTITYHPNTISAPIHTSYISPRPSSQDIDRMLTDYEQYIRRDLVVKDSHKVWFLELFVAIQAVALRHSEDPVLSYLGIIYGVVYLGHMAGLITHELCTACDMPKKHALLRLIDQAKACVRKHTTVCTAHQNTSTGPFPAWYTTCVNSYQMYHMHPKHSWNLREIETLTQAIITDLSPHKKA